MSLSRKTVSRRADQIGIQIYKKITDKLEQCNFFSMALDESTDTTDISQLLIMIRTIDIEYNISEEMFHCVPMYGTTKGVDIHMAVANVFKDVVSFDKLSAVCTDGAPAMRGEKNGFAGLLKANGVSVPAFHCIIHQHALSAKAGIIKETLNIAVSMVNKIKGGHNALNHRLFKFFCSEFGSEHIDLLLHNDIRWLSAGKMLHRLFELRIEVSVFLEVHVKNSETLQKQIKDKDFLQNLSFITDVTQLLNGLNLKLQGWNMIIFDLVSLIDCFMRKLNLLKLHIEEDNLNYFPCCAQIKSEFEDASFRSYNVYLEEIQIQFNNRFKDFELIRKYSDIYYNPAMSN